METLADLPTPALVLDLDRLDANLEGMAARASSLGVSLRPHVKTHKCLEIARRQRDLGARGLTVSTLYEARIFSAGGFDDLTWAFPVILSRIGEARALAEGTTLRLVVDSPEAVAALEAVRFPFHTWLKVDCGYRRAGVDPESPQAMELARTLARSRSLRFDGILSHSGHSYRGPNREAIRGIAEEERRVMVRFAARLRNAGIDVPAVSVGSTPAMAVVESLEGADEARPGNYAFYDHTQAVLGSCRPADCAVTVLASVVSSPPGARRSIVDAGALALSKDPGPAHGPATMGEVFEDYAAGRLSEDLRLVSLSQEHGILSARLPVGSRIRILPNHSCLTAAQFDDYAVVRGEEIADRWRVWRGRA